MATQTADRKIELKKETTESLQELIRALQDSAQFLNEASTNIKDNGLVSATFKDIASERIQICKYLEGLVVMNEQEPAEGGTFLGKLRSIWSAFRAGLNAGDPNVVLIEAERAEDAIVNKFRSVLPEIAGNPVNDKLNQFFQKVKQGHDRVLHLRIAFQKND